MSEKPFERFKQHAAAKPKKPGGIFKFTESQDLPDDLESDEPEEKKRRGRPKKTEE